MNGTVKLAKRGSDRRRALGALIASTLWGSSGIARAQAGRPNAGSNEGAGDVHPYLQVKPVRGEEEVVRVFFSPHCPYSRQYLGFFRNLQNTLPSSKRFEYSALVNRGDGVSYALAFEAVRKYLPTYIGNFVGASMREVQDHAVPTRTWAGLDVIGKAAQLPGSLARLVRAHEQETREAVDAAIRRQAALSVTNTPTVAIAGTYIVTPELTNGDAAVFSQLVNGLISMTI